MKPMNEYILIELETEKKTEGLFLGENKNKPKVGKILAFSEKCENKNFEVGKKVLINHYEMIPNGDSDVEFFVSEKAIIAIF